MSKKNEEKTNESELLTGAQVKRILYDLAVMRSYLETQLDATVKASEKYTKKLEEINEKSEKVGLEL